MGLKSLFRYVTAVSLLVGAACSQVPGDGDDRHVVRPETHRWFPVASGTHAVGRVLQGYSQVDGTVSCQSCHDAANTSFTQFQCTSCHIHSQALTDRLHGPTQAYAFNSTRCYACHADGSRVPFDHPGINNDCASCHDEGGPFAALPKPGFTHLNTHGTDCSSCHVKTSWLGASVAPMDAHDPLSSRTVPALIPTWNGTTITSLRAQDEVLDMTMNHATPQVPAATLSNCAGCHAGATSGNYYPGVFHSALDQLGVPQPAQCAECHTVAMPTGFVGPLATNLTAQNLGPRTPVSGEMVHDALLWANGVRTTTPVVTQDCNTCHLVPPQLGATWSTSLGGGSPAQFHASVATAGTSQPNSCLDCHANSRPAGTVTPVNAAGLVFDHGVAAALGDCVACHQGPTQFSSWEGGAFHHADAPTPTGCVPCHGAQRPTSTANWTSTTFQDKPFDFVSNGQGVGHGNTLDCVTCHNGPGTGAWGGTQNWAGGQFTHGPGTPSATTCITCHATQRPDRLPGTTPAAVAALLMFDHLSSGTGDCFGCHQATVTANNGAGAYVNYFDPVTHMLPGGDWKGARNTPSDAHDATHDITVQALVPTYQGATISAVTPSTQTLTMRMDHTTNQVSAATVDACINCHAGAATGVYYPGIFHASLVTLGLPQPTACNGCHAVAMPTGFVGPLVNATAPMANGPRTPASGEMLHDARLWSAGAFTAGAVVTQDCVVCHASPTQTPGAWNKALAGGTPAVFHAALGGTQPTTCLACHANSRPDGVLTSASAALSAGLSFDHTAPEAQQDCLACHQAGSTQFTAWSGGKFHLQGSAAPVTCLPCHASQRPTSTSGWMSPTWRDSPFDAVVDAQGVGHGNAMDCVGCHAGAGTGTWGGTQNWQGGRFVHGPGTPSETSCSACHATQRPDLQPGTTAAAMAALLNFDHATSGTGDCLGCHKATVVANNGAGAYVNYNNPVTHTLPGGDWQGAQTAPNDAHDPAHDVVVPSLVPTYAGTSIATLTGQTETLVMLMDHSSNQVPAAFMANCANCHVNAMTAEYLPGVFHASMANHSLAQPTTCKGCHQVAQPTGFVGPLAIMAAQNLGPRTPASGEMMHDAVAWSSGVRTGTPIVTQDCGVCHRSPTQVTATWSMPLGGGSVAVFHAALTSAGLQQPSTCLDCHANSRPTGVVTPSSGNTGLTFDHTQAAAQADCLACHQGGGSTFTSWAGGKYHLQGSTTPSTCLPCHDGKRPTTTSGWTSTTYQDSPFDYVTNAAGITHGDGLDCARCHAGPGTGTWGNNHNWAGGHFTHGTGASTETSCIACHSTQRPDLLPGTTAAAMATLLHFDHSTAGTADCLGCHKATTTAGTFVNYYNASHMLPGGDWQGAQNAPGDAHDPLRNVVVQALLPAWSGTSLTAVTPQQQTMVMRMDHGTAQVTNAVITNCTNCHDSAAALLGEYYPGDFHSSLANLSLPQPTACNGCHLVAMPTGFVGPLATNPARLPASGEMKHDAVRWTNGVPTTTRLVTVDCVVCHLGPSGSTAATWDNNRAGGTPATYHAALTAGAKPQPTSCIDCHANGRPGTGTPGNGVLTSPGADLPPNVVFDHKLAAAQGDCVSCHSAGGATQWTSWANGQYHLAGAAAPSTCLPCHTGERPTSTSGWISSTYQNTPFDYVTNARGITHGAGQDCVTCHAGPGTGAWGGTQNWAGGHYTHPAVPQPGAPTCLACHMTQRPDLMAGTTPAAVAALLGFDHAANGTGDCVGCHQATVTANTYVTFFNAAATPHGDWHGGVSYPGSTLVASPSQFVTATEITLQRSGAYNLVRGTSSVSATLHNAMLHTSAAIPAQVAPGPTANPNLAGCWHCHTHTAGTVTSYSEGRFHSALTNYSATPGGAVSALAQPTTRCNDCHAQMRPTGIVEKAASNLRPMDHNAVFTAPVVLRGVSVGGVAAMDCSACHALPGNKWDDGRFHPNIGAAVPQDCTVCHYPLMADAPLADLTSGVNYAMRHASAQVTFQNCVTCHTTSLAASATNAVAATSFNGGTIHPHVSLQPTACADCHTVSLPAASTQGTVTYTLAQGGTATNGRQWMNHASTDVVGKDCVVCHSADARTSGSAWSKAAPFHASVPGPTACSVCHGTTNGRGTVVGTNNNLPAGLTDSTQVTTTTSAPGVGLHDQLTHADVNVSGRDCNFCHTQVGPSVAQAVMGREWAQARFHANFTGANTLVMNGTTGRCSNCHMNVMPNATFLAQDHSTFTAVSGTQDCSSCHSYPGTGTAAAPNWLGAAGMPQFISVGGFTIPVPPAAAAGTVQGGINNLPHPAVAAGTLCTTCHASAGGGRNAHGYDHVSPLAKTNCNACHEAAPAAGGAGYNDLLGTLWNGATMVPGAGDSRPYTLARVVVSFKANGFSCSLPNHFYPTDCKECHKVPTGNGLVTTGAAYTAAWKFQHSQGAPMTNPATCNKCHAAPCNIPN